MSEVERKGGPAASRIKVLVVDDHDDAREVMLAFLRANGFSAEGARDGIQALRQVGAGGFDLVILDLVMPRLDGFEFLKRLRALPSDAAKMPVVVVSGRDAENVAGASVCFKKPAPLDELIDTVQKLGARS